jgi:hypothetical protein
VYLETGRYVRVSETLAEVAAAIDDPRQDGWLLVSDPGDGRAKCIPSYRVLWFEQEVEA